MTSSLQPPTKNIHFKGFNTLRFYAALSVIVQHCSYSPHDWFGQPLLPITLERFFLNGTDAVNLFFVLSGFLITYLLLVEHKNHGTISIRNFYIRRSLRIYPVYYMMLFIVYLLLRPRYELELSLMLIFFLGNVAFIRHFPFPPLEHLWSLGVEEQYYLTAPVIARFTKHLHKILLGILGFWLLLLAITYRSDSLWGAFIEMTRYDLIAVGALLGYYHYLNLPILRILTFPIVQLIAYAIIIGAIVFVKPTYNAIYTTIVAYSFGILVYNLATDPPWLQRFIYPRLEQLGNLSYSMYVYHPLFVLIFNAAFYETLPNYGFYIYPVVISISILVSWISYRYLERPFLGLKSRFKAVRSYAST